MKMIVFDLMGVIFRQAHSIKDVFHPLVEDKVGYKKLKEVYKIYSLGEISQEEFWNFVGEKKEKEGLDKIKKEDDILGVLKYLKGKDYKLGVLSNIPGPWGRYLLQKNKIKKYFDVIVLSGECGERKPRENIYKKFLTNIKTKPENCYFIDDKLRNLKEASEFKIKTIWRKIEEQDFIFEPDYILLDLLDLKKIF